MKFGVVISNPPYQEVFANLPQQDFSLQSDLDWTTNIAELDQQLFAKYHLTQGEQEHVKASLKEIGYS